jgi:hypothetical protein
MKPLKAHCRFVVTCQACIQAQLTCLHDWAKIAHLQSAGYSQYAGATPHWCSLPAPTNFQLSPSIQTCGLSDSRPYYCGISYSVVVVECHTSITPRSSNIENEPLLIYFELHHICRN